MTIGQQPKGLTKEDFSQLMDIHVDIMSHTLQSMVDKGLLYQEGERFFFTEKGQSISDAIHNSK